MAHDVQRPHDKLFRTVFADHGEAAALLRAHLPESLARDLRWSTLTLQDRSFVDPDLRDTESDLLFSIRRKAGAPPAWLYVLVEHQSRPDRWIRFRLLKYCCRIWDRSRAQFPRERRLRPIVPLVFYQGPGRWRHDTEFAELFADSVRDWPWVPRFAHLLIDQSRENPQAVRGRLHGRIAQLMMMARYRHRRQALRRAAQLLAELLPHADQDAVRTLVVYLWATQDRDTARQFGQQLRATVSGSGGDRVTYAEELMQEMARKVREEGLQEGRETGLQEGHRKGLLQGQVGTIENLLRAGVQWSVIEAATGIDQDALRALRQRLEGSDEGMKEPD